MGAVAEVIEPAEAAEPDLAERLRAGDRAVELRGAWLVDADLRGVDLTGRDLSRADLSRADLREATLVGADLTGATLHGTRLEGAELAGAKLVGAHLEAAEATSAGFGRADLTGATLFGGTFDHASFVEAKLDGVDARTASLSGARLKQASLLGADFDRATLVEAELSGSAVTGASFDDADLRRSRLRLLEDFERASFLRSDVRDVDFSGAYLLRRHILDENFLDEFRRRGHWNTVMYWLWWVTSDCGRSLFRWGLWIIAISALFGVAYQFVDVDFGDSPTWLSPYYYSVVTLTSLGYGDVLPQGVGAQALAMSEVVVGYVMLGGLISIFANKLARRGE
jgi:uncharacterized protein YjbI with pentapeptide repeats